MHSGPFVCLTKLGAKRAELVQKFVLRIHVGIFLNERTRSTPLDPKMTFWCVSYYLGAFSQMNAPDPPHWTLKLHFGAFRTIWVHSGPFGCLTKLGAKRAELVQKFVLRIHVGIFPNERTRSTPLDPKMTFWCVSYYLGAFSQMNAPDPPHWTLN